VQAFFIPKAQKAQRVRSKVKVLLTVFFDYRGIVYHSYAPEGQTINKEYYLEVIRHLRDAGAVTVYLQVPCARVHICSSGRVCVCMGYIYEATSKRMLL
jgi:hypothetical protein